MSNPQYFTANLHILDSFSETDLNKFTLVFGAEVPLVRVAQFRFEKNFCKRALPEGLTQ